MRHPQTPESKCHRAALASHGDEEYTPTETVRTISQKIVSDTGVHGTKQAETKALPKTTEATTISILDPTQESGADESQKAGSGSDESEKETGNASETQENDVSEQESRPDGTHASKENARESAEAESLAVLRRHFRAEILAPARRMAEKNLPAAVPRMEAVHREVRRMRESSLSDERV